MKHRLTKITNLNTAKSACTVAVLVLSVGGLLASHYTPLVRADKWDDQIRALQNENRQYGARAEELRTYAGTLAEELAQLEAEKSAIQAQINTSIAKVNDLKQQITETEKKIDDTREALGEVLTEIYLAGQISPLERFASRKSLTEFIDEESSRENLQHSLNQKVKEINSYKNQLENQKKEVERVLEDQKSQEAVLLSKEQEQANLLAQTKGEEASYRKLADNNNAQIEKLRDEQRRANLAAMQSMNIKVPGGVAGGGGYPGAWAYAPINAFVDSWGMYSRQCVSYTAWKVWSTGRYMPHWGGRGNANQWPSSARADGIPTGYTPKVGAVAVWHIGYYGHVMYVEAVNGDGTIEVSDYNLAWDGLYRKYTRSAAGLEYIYF